MTLISPNFPEGEEKISLPETLYNHFSGDKISVSLKYYNSSCECFSAWQKRELKGFSRFIGKLIERTGDQIRQTTQTCHAHMGNPKKSRFSRPIEISPDIKFYSLDVGKKERVHGFFNDPIFFLVWLDRNHECF